MSQQKKLSFLCSFPSAQSKNDPAEKNYHSYAPSLLRGPKMGQQKISTILTLLLFAQSKNEPAEKKTTILTLLPFCAVQK
jgi:hypothetical protein